MKIDKLGRMLVATAIVTFMLFTMSRGLPVFAADNLVSNGGLETLRTSNDPASGPSNWSYSKTGTAPAISGWGDVLVSGDSQRGNYIKLPYGDWMGISPYVPVTAGNSYDISFLYHSQTDNRARILVSFHTFNQETQTYSNEIAGQTLIRSFASTNSTWQSTAVKIVVPETATHVKLTFRALASVGEGSGSEPLYFDDLSLTPSADTPLVNDGMELADEGNMPEGWKTSGGAAGVNYTLSDTFYLGLRSLKITGDGSNTLTAYQNIPLSGGAKYIISAYVKTDGTVTGAAVTASKDNLKGAVLGSKTLTTTNGAWQKVLLSGLVSGEGGITLALSLTGEGAAYFDGFQLEPDRNLLANASLETVTKDGSGIITDAPSWKKSSALNWNDCISTDGNCPNGNNYLKYTSASSTSLFAFMEITLTKGQSYSLSLWYKSDNTRARVKVEFAGTGADVYSPVLNFPSTNGTWKKYTMIFTVPTLSTATGVTRIQLRLTGTIPAGGQVSFDSFYLEPAGNHAGFYSNAGFTINPGGTPEFENLGAEVPALTEGTVQLRFHSTGSETGVTVLSVLCSYDGSGNKIIENITADDVAFTVSDDTNRDIGFKVPITVGALEPGKTYFLEAYVWNNLNEMNPFIPRIMIRN